MFYVEKSNNLIYRENTGAKTQDQAVTLLEMTESFCCFYGCLPKNQHHISIQFWHNAYSTLGINLACPGVPGHTHINGMNRPHVFIYASAHVKCPIHTSANSWDIIDSLLLITLSMPDHTQPEITCSTLTIKTL